jgi:hypothetical protein
MRALKILTLKTSCIQKGNKKNLSLSAVLTSQLILESEDHIYEELVFLMAKVNQLQRAPEPVFWIRNALIRIRIRGSVPLVYGS